MNLELPAVNQFNPYLLTFYQWFLFLRCTIGDFNY